MRFYYAQATALAEQVDAQSGQPANATERRRHARMLSRNDKAKRASGQSRGEGSAVCASADGLYYVSDDDGDDEFVPLAERLAYYNRRDEIKGCRRHGGGTGFNGPRDDR